MKQCGLRHPVVFLAFMMLAWQEPISPDNEGIEIEGPGREICITCPGGSTHKEIPRITIEELKQKMDSGADIVIVDAQPKATYDKGHIKGALSFPWAAKITQWDVRQLPRDKMIITYCDCGPGEADSSDLAAQLKEMGFSNVKVLADPSIRGWIKAGYPIEK
jgi:rhodanese-related sulfurtransferase